MYCKIMLKNLIYGELKGSPKGDKLTPHEINLRKLFSPQTLCRLQASLAPTQTSVGTSLTAEAISLNNETLKKPENLF